MLTNYCQQLLWKIRTLTKAHASHVEAYFCASVILTPFIASVMVTWSTFIAALPESLQSVALFVRNYFAEQGQPLTFMQFLALEPLPSYVLTKNNSTLTEAWFSFLQEHGESAVTKQEFIDSFSLPEQPFAVSYVASLDKAGISYEQFRNSSVSDDAAELLYQSKDPVAFATRWQLALQALQTRGQVILDQEERLAAFYAAIGEPAHENFAQLLGLIQSSSSFASLHDVALMPLNKLALQISPISNTFYLTFAIQQLGELAAQVIEENYTPALTLSTYLSKVPFEQSGVQALLELLAPGQTATAIQRLADNAANPETLVAELSQSLTSNHPFTYALAQAFQSSIISFLADYEASSKAEQPSPAPELLVWAFLTGLEAKPIYNAGIRLTQILSETEEIILGELYTSSDGSFPMRLRLIYQIDSQDKITPLLIKGKLHLFAPGQSFDSPPHVSIPYQWQPGDSFPLGIISDLSNDLPLLLSEQVQALDEYALLSADSKAYLNDKGIVELADIRRVGGLLNQDGLSLTEPTEHMAARRLDGLAQFEVVSTDSKFNERLLDKGFFSPQQLLTSVSREELVQLLVAENAGPLSDTLRLQTASFYEQAVAVDALTQAIGLFTAAENASYGETIALLDDDTTGELSPPAAEKFQYEPFTGAVNPQFNPATPALPTSYQAGQQCDCAACRSAVGPTAYLAALLKYAETNLRTVIAGQKVSPDFLQTTFLQSLCDLAVSCQHAEEKVCQYRLAIEVIQKYWRTRLTPGRALTFADGKSYVGAVLEALLQSSGTSTKELQGVFLGTNDEAIAARISLAKRLQLPVSAFNTLKDRFGAGALVNTRPLDTIEDDLEQIFGLASTARDPLSTGSLLTSAVSAVQLVRWSFQELHWALNTGQDGTLFVEIQIDIRPSPRHKVVVYKDEKSEDTVVARGTFVAAGTVATGGSTVNKFTAILYPQHSSNLKGSVVITLNPVTAADTTFQVSLLPAITAWRMQTLAAEWQQADAELVAPVQQWNSDLPFIIDPDVLGPDDFRPVAPMPLLGAPGNPAYRIWQHRLSFLDSQSFQEQAVDYLGALMDSLTDPNSRTYPAWNNATTYPKQAWKVTPSDYASLPGSGLITRIQANLQAADVALVNGATAALKELGLTRTAFDRLYALWKKSETGTPTTALTAAEEQEAFEILRQTFKKTFAQVWADEEAAHGITISGKWFQTTIHEPQEGIWDKIRADEFGIAAVDIPRIDPDESTPLELPDPGTFGDEAARLWGTRKTQLQKKQAAIAASGVGIDDLSLRADTMVEYAYRANPTVVGSLPSVSLENQWIAYQDATSPAHDAAVLFFSQTLALRPAEAERLMALRSQMLTTPSDALWLEMAGILALGWKRVIAYQVPYRMEDALGVEDVSWLQVEHSAPESVASDPFTVLYRTRKHRLIKWRASVVTRTKWVAALRQAAQRPLIDPDQLVAGDFRQAGERSRNVLSPPLTPPAVMPFLNPAFELYNRRAKQVNDWYDELHAAWLNPAQTHQALVASQIGTSWPALEELYRQLHKNVDVAAVLLRLNLTGAALDLLIDQVGAANADQLPALLHLLVQVKKIRQYADWQREEVAQGVYLNPLYFHEPQTEPVPLTSLPWRSAARERRQWQRNLATRFEQAQATADIQQQAVKSIEDQYLPLLRDVLLDYKVTQPSVTASREAKAESLSAKYLLDFKIACCQHTTRVAQGIDIMQRLFFAQRSGLVAAIPGLTLTNSFSSFENDWQWLGSYERWRSLMFLYLYPQNVLLPTLRIGQTPMFQQIAGNIRQRPTVTPANAARYVEEYNLYLTEVASLRVGASLQTSLEASRVEGLLTTTTQQPVSLQFAVSASRAAYANMYQLADALPTEKSFNWLRLPGEAKIESLAGAATYQTGAGERYAYLFVLLREEQKTTISATPTVLSLAFQRLNLKTLTWDDEYTTLAVSGEGALEANNTLVAGGIDETWPPIVTGIRNYREALFTEAPFPFSFNTSDSTIDNPEGYRVGEVVGPIYNVDLFSVALDAQGTGVGYERTQPFYLIAKIQLLSCVRTSITQVFYSSGLQISQYSSNFFTTFSIDLTEESPKPIVSSQLQLPSATPAAIYIHIKNLFPSATNLYPVFYDLFFTGAIRELLRRNTFSFTDNGVITSDGPNQRITLENQLVPVGSRITEVATQANSLGQLSRIQSFSVEIYFNHITSGSSRVGNATHKIALYSNAPHVSMGTSNTVVSTAAAITDIRTAYYAYVGPLLRSGYTASPTASAYTPYEVLATYAPGNFGSIGQTTIKRAAGSYSTLHQPLPVLPSLLNALSPDTLNERRTALAALTGLNTAGFVSNLVNEGYYSLPVLLATELSRSRNYEEALRYFRLVYDYTRIATAGVPNAGRIIFPTLGNTGTDTFDTALAWLTQADNPYRVASLRPNAHLQFVVMSVVRCLLAYADSEFTRDTVESVSRARSLYELALKPLRQDILSFDVQDCYAILNQLDVLVVPAWAAEWQAMKDLLAAVNQRQVILNILEQQTINDTPRLGIIQLFSQARGDGSWATQFNAAWTLINADLGALIGKYETLCDTQGSTDSAMALPTQQRPGLPTTTQTDASSQMLAKQVQERFMALAKQIELARQVEEQTNVSNYSWLARKVEGNFEDGVVYPPELQLQLALRTTRPFVPFYNASFCVPTNPVPYALLLQAELNLYKIRTCRNIAGLQRELDPYAAPTDTTSGMPVIGANGQLSTSGRLVVPATQYRYVYIIERARQLVALAQQAESSLLSTLEKRDSEAYNLLKARQDIAVNKASVQLQNLRTKEAEDSIDLAELQLQRSELMENQYTEWLDQGIIQFEQDLLDAISSENTYSIIQTSLNAAASAIGVVATAAYGKESLAGVYQAASMWAAVAGIGVANARADIQIAQFRATNERRMQEWAFLRNQASKDIEIGQQQIHLSEDRMRIVGQEKRISELQLDHAEVLLNFLTTKFTSAELYDWMSQVLESAYSYFLQQATATARTAELQLAFERQEVPAGMVQEDYWTPPADSSSVMDPSAVSAAVDRKGLTGSIRLLQDLTRLDQYAFETNRRKLQLTKTVSLAQDFPTEFVRFRETGVLPFAIPQTRFDQDFPGHYLRIIRRVRTSVIALVPPTDGIKAKLSTAGNSRVVVGGTPFQTLTLPRPAESVSLTSPINATGLFELEQQANELLYPFEGTGVDVPWVFSLQPAANGNLDFTTIADVLITLEYTALESYDYGQQVVKGMEAERQQMVAFSFRNRFADQWYDLHHAADLALDDRYVARFSITAADLPTNLREVTIRSVSIYLDAPLDDEFTDRSGLDISLSRSGSGNAVVPSRTNQYGLISTRTGAGNGPLATGNARALISLINTLPTGDWELNVGFTPALKARFDQGKVNDLYLILEVEGTAPTYTLV
ncbi:hypothetical protein Q5H93_23545 [Hymenobacter sp. ASUV-10]|uniref:Uncharacterized protein n=1 Tax=Hymenobacter aranciens TaxID=3063996 RepID=A0ABT9BHI9_9BACT|nr:neuraminidase-like domain-containing protein [Hymenobacter sp. ASUV-10]MDO7877731.1 hypothetical protein [Hymenobacter sp. ASUV-10]